MKTAAAILSLDEVFHRVLPELRSLPLADETLVDCGACPLISEHFDDEPHDAAKFNPETRCCTHYPCIPNFLLGKALLEGGQGATVIRKRLEDRSGVLAWGIVQPESRRGTSPPHQLWFGKDREQLCPYYVGGQYACGIWRYRNGTCRTWFCRYEHGADGLTRWKAVKALLTAVEDMVGEHLASLGSAPNKEDDVERWVEWYIQCAHAVGGVTASDILDRADDAFREKRRKVADLLSTPLRDMPDVLVPRIQTIRRSPKGFEVFGHSPFDYVAVDRAIIRFFLRLDGVRPWRAAMEETNAENGPVVDESLVRALYDRIILQSPEEIRSRLSGFGFDARRQGMDETLPEVLVPAVQKPIAVDGGFWIQGEVSLASLIVPASVFRFFGHLDGERPWRDALENARGEGVRDVDVELVERLYRIGALRPPRSEAD